MSLSVRPSTAGPEPLGSTGGISGELLGPLRNLRPLRFLRQITKSLWTSFTDIDFDEWMSNVTLTCQIGRLTVRGIVEDQQKVGSTRFEGGYQGAAFGIHSARVFLVPDWSARKHFRLRLNECHAFDCTHHCYVLHTSDCLCDTYSTRLNSQHPSTARVN